MTPLEEALLARIEARVAKLEPKLAQRLLAAYRLLRSTLTDAELRAAISSGLVEPELNRLLNDARLDPLFMPVRVQIDQALIDAARLSLRDLPVRAGAFNFLNPQIVEAARILDTRVIDGLKTELRETVLQHAIAGIEAGEHPTAVARGIRSVLELAPNQEAAVRNFRRMLVERDYEALTRELRDHRFDGAVRKAFSGSGLSADRIDQMTEAYRRRMVAFNANTHARSAALDAQRAGQRATWQDAIDRGVVDGGRLQSTWLTVRDSHVRPSHRIMHGVTVPFGQPYPNGDTVVGGGDYGCRCFERISVARVAVAA